MLSKGLLIKAFPRIKQTWQPLFQSIFNNGLKIESELAEWGKNPLQVKSQCSSWGRKVYWVEGVGETMPSRDERSPLNTITKISEGGRRIKRQQHLLPTESHAL